MTIHRLPCPGCGATLKVPPESLGNRVGRCRKCGQRSTLAPDGRSLTPRPEKQAAPPAPASKPVKSEFGTRHEALAVAQVVPDAERCVQCGICSYNCPMEIDVRAHAWRGLPIHDSHCLTCSECVNRCPRSVLRFERIPLVRSK